MTTQAELRLRRNTTADRLIAFVRKHGGAWSLALRRRYGEDRLKRLLRQARGILAERDELLEILARDDGQVYYAITPDPLATGRR